MLNHLRLNEPSRCPQSGQPRLQASAPWALAWQASLQQHRVVAVIQAPSPLAGLAMAAAAVSGGIELLEVTLSSDRPFHLIDQLRSRWPHCQVGVGSVLSLQQFQDAVAAGAQFGFSPILQPPVLEQAFRLGIPFMAGALTPNEIWQAWQLGATAVKVFPIQSLGGVTYLKHLRAPLGPIPLIPTGGITLENAAEFVQAGAIALCVGGALFPSSLVQTQNWEAIAQRARRLMACLEPFQIQPLPMASFPGPPVQDGGETIKLGE